MFTGIIQHQAQCQQILTRSSGLSIQLATPYLDAELGESIAVNGVCLTVVDNQQGLLSFDVSPETLSKTVFSALKSGDFCHVERALQLGDRLGGHFVYGHVDQTIILTAMKAHGDYTELTFSVDPENAAYLVPKGSVACHGISLTINTCGEDFFTVMIVPHTLENTQIGTWQVEDEIHVEYDYLAKIIAHQHRGE